MCSHLKIDLKPHTYALRKKKIKRIKKKEKQSALDSSLIKTCNIILLNLLKYIYSLIVLIINTTN